MYYLTYDGEDKEAISENLAEATDAFYKAVERIDWCPALVDDEGVILVSYDNSNYDSDDFDVIIGPVPDQYWLREHGGWSRIAEEHDYKFGEWRL